MGGNSSEEAQLRRKVWSWILSAVCVFIIYKFVANAVPTQYKTSVDLAPIIVGFATLGLHVLRSNSKFSDGIDVSATVVGSKKSRSRSLAGPKKPMYAPIVTYRDPITGERKRYTSSSSSSKKARDGSEILLNISASDTEKIRQPNIAKHGYILMGVAAFCAAVAGRSLFY